MSITRFMTFFLLVSFVWVVGCTPLQPMPTPDAVKGWKCLNANFPPSDYHIDQAIIDDYQAFAHQVWPKGYDFFLSASQVFFYEDGTGKHAVRIEVETGQGEEYIDYYLLYNTRNVRTKVIKGKKWVHFHM